MAHVQSSPPALRPRSWRRRAIAIGLTLAGLAGVALLVWYIGFRQVVAHYPDDEEHYKYGSIGNATNGGIPYWIWLVLPRVFPEYLPSPEVRGNGGYASLGMVWEEARTVNGEFRPGGGPQSVDGLPSYSVPVGFSVTRVGIIPMVAMNCAVCHTAAVRRPGEEVPMLFPGGPSHQLDSLGYIRFLVRCARDPRFTADVLLPQIGYNVKLTAAEKLLYRYVVIPQTKEGLLNLWNQYSWSDTLEHIDDLQPQGRRTEWGRGRIDPFNPVKFGVLGMNPRGDNTTGNADMPPLWDLERREGMALHWDGLNTSVREVVLSSAIGDGATLDTIDLDGLLRVENYLRRTRPPKFESIFPGQIRKELAEQGASVYRREKCDECHDFGKPRTGTIIPVEELQTDPERHKLWGDEAARRYNAYADGYPWDFSKFRGTDGPGGGYASVPLDGVWIRAPFLHNGSVPTLRDLLDPPDERPVTFYRGNDVYDPAAGGFVHDKPVDGWRKFSLFDTRQRANGNGGHLWGTTLPDEEKDALVEYMKTL